MTSKNFHLSHFFYKFSPVGMKNTESGLLPPLFLRVRSEKGLDEIGVQVQNRCVMRMQKRFSVLQSPGVAVLGLVTLLGLASCGDEEKGAKEEAAPAAETAPAAPAAPSTAKRDALFQDLLFGIGKTFTENASNPAWTEMVRNHLVMLQEYYDEMAPANAGTLARTKIAVRIGEVLNELGSFTKSREAFDKALEDFGALGDADKATNEANRLMSAIQIGLGSDLLSQGKATDALPHYEKALEADLKTLSSVLPEDKMPLPEGEVAPDIASAVSDVISSYCCLAFCQRAAEDPEEARETIKKGQELVKKIDKLSMSMSLRYARLLTTLGDLESACGNLKEALSSWVGAARVCEQVYKQSGNEKLRAEARVRFRQLAAAVRAVQEQIGEEADRETPTDLTDDAAPAAEGGTPSEGQAPAAN